MTIESMLSKELNKLEEIVDKTEKRLSVIPKGRLRVVQKQGRYEYYLREEKSHARCGVGESIVHGVGENAFVNGRYLRKDEINTAMAIAQRDYDIQVLKKAKERKKTIEWFLEKYESTSLKEIYTKMCSGRKNLIDAERDNYLMSDEEFVKRWLAVEYKGKGFSNSSDSGGVDYGRGDSGGVDSCRGNYGSGDYDNGDSESEAFGNGGNEQMIITEQGERVRSKSEKIIADKLYMLGIPYRYECPALMKGRRGNVTIYPDFTILRMPERREVYFEHFGLMDDADYVNAVMHKLDTYEKNGIYLGINLFFTHETSKRPLNTVVLDRLLREAFCECG